MVSVVEIDNISMCELLASLLVFVDIGTHITNTLITG